MEEGLMLAGKGRRGPDWTALPGELLACIRGRLPPADFARFPAVCTAWRSVAPSTPARQLPWLLVPPSPTSSPDDGVTCRFFSPSEGKTYLVPAPELRGTRCLGSWEGWLAASGGSKARVSLVNPLTRARLLLPSPFISMPEFDEPHGQAWKVVMSSAPTDPTGTPSASFAWFRSPVSPAFFSLGREHRWAVLPEGAGYLADIVYHDGGYYGVNIRNRVFRWRAAANTDLVELYYRPALDFPTGFFRYQRHLAVHPSGDLLLLFVDALLISLLYRGAPESGVQKVERVMAFKYRGGDGGSPGAWLRLKSLDGCSVFLGRNQSICLSPQDVPELRTDCVFLIGKNSELNDMMRPCWTYGAWVYDLKEGTLEPYGPHCKIYQTPLWFTPNLS